VLIEINDSDGDAGFQMLIDGDGWKEVKVDDPNGQKIYTVKGDKSVEEQGLTENFFESAEPDCNEPGFSLDETLDRFPAGEYRVRGKSTDNEHFEGEATLTHAIPASPDELKPDPADGLVNSANPVMIEWANGNDLEECPPIDIDLDPSPADVQRFGYQVVVEREFPEPLQVFTIDLGANDTSVTLPAEFVSGSSLYKYEVIAIEDNEGERGNQSIKESHFCTDGFIGDCEPD
jgi:hypothetical protein